MNVTLVIQDESAPQAFVRGMLKGLAAPLMLFAANKAELTPGALPPLPEIAPVELPQSLTTTSDLERIGADFWSAVRRYEQEGPQHSTIGSQAR